MSLEWEEVEEGIARVRDPSSGESEWRFVDAPALCESRSRDGWRWVEVRARLCRGGVRVLRDVALGFVAKKGRCGVCLRRAEVACECGAEWCGPRCRAVDADHPCDALATLAGCERARPPESLLSFLDFGALRLAARLWRRGVSLEPLCHHRDRLVAAARRGDRSAESALQAARVGANVLAQALGRQDDDDEEFVLALLRLRFNAFPFETGLAVFRDASALNHSCAPNSAVSIRRDDDHHGRVVLEARAHVDLHRGAEVTITYLSLRALVSRDARRAALRDAFFFSCACAGCGPGGYDVDPLDLDAVSGALLGDDNNNNKDLVLAASRRADAILAAIPAGAAVPVARARLRLLAARTLLRLGASDDARAIARATLDDDLIPALGRQDPHSRLAAAYLAASPRT
ncbi:hypothetical protein CTAYLR_002429 [Chrysophaeum taylorii]|uniref:SET domain-containing protein n=1 Tax=Chrysophaeum taylorii TaxID=2483200 RepID=A0AAD7XQY2_9STRA|nr:hypothetical protein CTAYLR_002429 [Chrysophaeum taylorii]